MLKFSQLFFLVGLTLEGLGNQSGTLESVHKNCDQLLHKVEELLIIWYLNILISSIRHVTEIMSEVNLLSTCPNFQVILTIAKTTFLVEKY